MRVALLPVAVFFVCIIMCVNFCHAQAGTATPGTFVPTSNMSTARNLPSATLLQNGKILVIGGSNNQGALTSAELYDPATGTFSPTGSMSFPRGDGHTATMLPNGQILVSGGAFFPNIPAERYDPVSGH